MDGQPDTSSDSIIYTRNRGGRPRRNPAKRSLKFHVFTSSQYWQNQEYGKSRIDLASDVVENPGESDVPQLLPENSLGVKSDPLDDVDGKDNVHKPGRKLPIEPVVKIERMNFGSNILKQQTVPVLENVFKSRKTSRPGIEETIKKMKTELDCNGKTNDLESSGFADCKGEGSVVADGQKRRKRKPDQTRKAVIVDTEPREPKIREKAVKVPINGHQFISPVPKSEKKMATVTEHEVHKLSANEDPLRNFPLNYFQMPLGPLAKYSFDAKQYLNPLPRGNAALPQHYSPFQLPQIPVPNSSVKVPSAKTSQFPQYPNSPYIVDNNEKRNTPTSTNQVGGMLRHALNPINLPGTSREPNNYAKYHAANGALTHHYSSTKNMPEVPLAKQKFDQVSTPQHCMPNMESAIVGSSRKRKNCRSLVRQQLEQTFKKKGFLVQTKQVSSGTATFCKFRQLNKYSRYYLKIWHKHLPEEVNKLWKGFLPPKDRH